MVYNDIVGCIIYQLSCKIFYGKINRCIYVLNNTYTLI